MRLIALLTVLAGLFLPAFPTCAQTCAPSVEPTAGGYVLHMATDLVRGTDPQDVSGLRLYDPKLGESVVRGTLRVLTPDIAVFHTSEALGFTPRPTTEVALVNPHTSGPFGPCFEAEFALGCTLTWCAGTRYCLPGPGPGGFVCSCV